jgi:hypothetical protein
MQSDEPDDGLVSILQQGLVASAMIEVDLRFPRAHEGIIGFTTESTVITWQVDGLPQHYRVSNIPVRFKKSSEDLVQLALYGHGASKRLQLLISLCNWPSLTSEMKIRQLQPSRFEVQIAKLEVIAGAYYGAIDACHATFETDKASLAGLFID